MKNTTLIHRLCLPLVFALMVTGCKKEDSFLSAKPNQALAIPSNLEDLQLLIGNEDVFNRYYPALGEASTDDMILTQSDWLNDYPSSRNAYIWAKDIHPPGENIADWSSPYTMVYYANTVLNLLPTLKITDKQQAQAGTIKGSALFFRSIAFYNLVQTYALPYDPATAGSDLGVPMPLVADLNAKIGRSTVSECYRQIIADLRAAAELLPNQPSRKTLPSKAAVFALLARIYLVTGNYDESLNYASQCLALYSQLQDFNKLKPSAFPMYPDFSPEEIFHASLEGYAALSFKASVDTGIYRSFSDRNDLRPSIFFYNNKGKMEFNSQFDTHNNISTPISTSEVYLTKAECEARLEKPDLAMNDLNTFLKTRWKTGTFKPYSASSAEDALRQILAERKKELVMTGIRWSDLRRLNKDPRFAITLRRNINGTVYTLPPNDPRYALPIPENEILLNPMPQNNR